MFMAWLLRTMRVLCLLVTDSRGLGDKRLPFRAVGHHAVVHDEVYEEGIDKKANGDEDVSKEEDRDGYDFSQDEDASNSLLYGCHVSTLHVHGVP